MARKVFSQMMLALKHSHDAGYAHRDIKPENLLLDNNYNLKLADFGFAKILAGDDGSFNLNTYCGTRNYMAPEILNDKTYKGVKVDIFSAGIMLFLFSNARPPFSAADVSDNVWKTFFLGNDMKSFWIEWTKMFKCHFSKDYMLLVTSMLNPNPEKRPDIDTILDSNWMRGEMATDEEVRIDFAETRQQKVNNGITHEKEEEFLNHMKAFGIDGDQWNKVKNMIEKFIDLESIPHLAMPEQYTCGDDSPGANTKAIKLYNCKRDLKTSLLNLGYILEALKCEYDFDKFQKSACINGKGKCKDGKEVLFEVHVYVDDTTNKITFEFIRNKTSHIMSYYEYINRIVRKLNILDNIEDEVFEKANKSK